MENHSCENICIYFCKICMIFRWFKFTVKPPYSIAHDKLQLAIWDTSFWTFDQNWTQGTFRHILGPILVIFEICHFLAIPGLSEYFSEKSIVDIFDIFWTF